MAVLVVAKELSITVVWRVVYVSLCAECVAVRSSFDQGDTSPVSRFVLA